MNKIKLEDRQYLKILSKALDISEGRIKTDTYGDWNIVGSRGHISTEGDFWYLYTDCGSVRKWNITKENLSFMEVSQDGDVEGILKCARMPLRDEARAVRKVIGVRPSTKLTEVQREVLKRNSFTGATEGFKVDSIRLNEKDVCR